MAAYLMRRILKGMLTIFVSVTITFFILRLMPADPVLLVVDPKMSVETQNAMKAKFGLDKPVAEQYVIFVINLLQGDLGLSFKTREPVMQVVLSKLPWTLLLLVIVISFSMLIGIPVGVQAARQHNKGFDRFISTFTMFSISIFIPFLSFAFIYFLAYSLKLFPTGGAYTPPPAKGFDYYVDVARHAVLPSLTLFINVVAAIIMYTRNSMLDVLKEDYIRTAYSKGWNAGYVVRTHGLKNAMIPTITAMGLMICAMVGGAVMTETVYAWPGVGRLIFDSVSALDYPVLQGAFLVLSATVVVTSILSDLVVAWLDPRIRLG